MNNNYSGSQAGSSAGGSYMGGTPGDWQQQQQQQQQYNMPNQPQPPATPGYSAYPQNTPANTPATFSTPQQQHPQGYPAGSGSITRFATPQQQPGTPLYPQSSPYDFSPPPQPNANGASAGMSYTERAAMLQKQQGGYPQQQQQPQQIGGYPQQQPQQNQYAPQPQQQVQYRPQAPQQQPQAQYGHQPQMQQPAPQATSGMSFAQRSQALMQNQPQQSNVYRPHQPKPMQNSYPQPGTPQRPPGPGAPATPQQQQQPQYGGMNQQQQPGMPSPQQQQQPGMMSPQQQQQPGMPNQQRAMQSPQQQSMMGGGSFAQRSQMAHSMVGSTMAGSTMGQSQMMPPQQQQMPPQQQQPPARPNMMVDPPEVVAQQNRLLTDATRKVQEHAYYMKQAMDRNDLPTVLDRAASMVGELGEHAHSHHHHHSHPPAPGASGSTTALSPKNYYELHLRALEELPTLEDYLLNIAQGANAPPAAVPPNQMGMAPNQMAPNNNPLAQNTITILHTTPNQAPAVKYTMKELYDCVQYCPNVLSRLYLQICAASALIRSGEVGARFVLRDMIEAVKCVQNPVRGLFLRHYLLQALRDKMPDAPIPLDQVGGPIRASSANEGSSGAPPVVTADVNNTETGSVKDSYEFILANFIEMNKLWVRIQHLPGDGKSKEVRRRREKDRNELRILVGTNLVRLSAIESITSSIYGQVILPTVLEHIVICGDPLAQAYLIDCIVQVFPDEYHIETMPILLGVCPKLRDKVNVRTILQSLMDRLANYLADEELLDEADSNQVKRSLANDSFRMFDECVQNVYNARGPKLQAKEVIRLQTALLSFTMKCYQGNMEQMTLCLNHCVVALQQASANQALLNDSNMAQQQTPQGARRAPLDDVATKELEKLLSIPLEELALGVLNMDYYADLISFLPWNNRRHVALTMLESVSKAGTSPDSVKEIEELFSVIAPVLREEHDTASGVNNQAQSNTMDRTANLMAGLGVSPSPQAHYQQQMSSSSLQDVDPIAAAKDGALVSKLVHLLNHPDTDVVYEMFTVARKHLSTGRRQRSAPAYEALVFASLKLATTILDEETGNTKETKKEEEKLETPTEEKTETPSEEKSEEPSAEPEDAEKPEEATANPEETVTQPEETEGATTDDAPEAKNKPDGEEFFSAEDSNDAPAPEPQESSAAESVPPEVENPAPAPKVAKSISCRKVFVFIQEIISSLSKSSPEKSIKLYMEAALTADKLNSKGGKDSFGQITYELIAQAFALYEENSGDSRLQGRCMVAMVGTLLACRSLSTEEYESLIMKTAQYSAKMLKKTEQCEMVALCSYLFYVVENDGTVVYSKPQRGLECLQRALKLADACTNSNPANVRLFVDLLEHYLYFFEKEHPSVTGNYIAGLVALINEHTNNLGPMGSPDSPAVGEAKAHFLQIVRHIKRMKEKKSERFANIDVSSIST